MKTLKDFLEVYKPKSPDEQKFVDKHVVIKHKDRNGNGDDVFKATNIKTIKRKEERHGYDVGEDEKVYEEIEVNEDTFTDASLANLRVMKHKQEMKKIESSSKLAPPMKVRKMSDAKKTLAKLEAQRDHFAAKHEKAMSRKKKVNEDVILDELLDEAIDLLNAIDEKTLTPAEMKKREEVVKAIKRENPKMDKSMAYAVATKTAKRVAEGTMPTADEPTEANKKTAQKVRDMMAKEKKPVKEEAEQIDELSKKTLGSYVKKASGAEQPKNVMSPKNVPLTKIAAYQGDSETGYFGKRFNQHTYDKAERLRKNRETGIKRAVDKITKEEVESIDELSKGTMGRYINKAKNQIDAASWRTGYRQGVDPKADATTSPIIKSKEKQLSKRHKGIETAVKKLTKEDIINRTIEKYVPEEVKYTPEERLMKRLNGLSEAHINTLLGLFEALNKDNKNKMIESVKTREGINQLLDFALNNRGE